MQVKKAEGRLREMLASHYRLIGTDSEQEHETRGVVKGFCEALVFNQTLKPDQIENIIQDEHLKAFGMTREARMLLEQPGAGPWNERNWERFDKPTIERRGARKHSKISTAGGNYRPAIISVS